MANNLLRLSACLALLGLAPAVQAQVGIGTSTPDPSAVLDLKSTTQGLLPPRMTASQILAITSPADGLLVYQTDGLQPGLRYFRAGTGWTYLNPTGADNLGSHSATQALSMNGLPINFGTALTQQLNLWNADYGIGIQPSTLMFRTGSGFAWYKSGSYVATQNDPGAGGTAQMLLTDNGNLGLGIGAASPEARLHVGGALRLDGGVIQRGGPAITNTADLGLYSRQSGSWMRFVTNGAPIRFFSDDNSGTNPNLTIESSGNVGIGLGLDGAANRLDVRNAGRSGSHATGRALYATGDFGEASNGVEFRHSNATQGIGFGYNSLYAAGTNADQHLNLMPKGNGNVGIGTTSPGQKLQVAGQIYSSTGGFRFPDGSVQATAATTPVPQSLALSGQTLSISGGNAVTLPTPAAQNLTLSGQTLGISGGNTVTLPVGADHLGNHTATQNLNLGTHQLVGNGGTSGLAISSGGGVGIGGPAAASAQLDVSSTTKGFLPPRLTEAQRDAIASPAPGLVIYNTTLNKLNVWNGTAWTESLNNNDQGRVFQFNYTGGPQTWTVPAGITSVRVDMGGAQGGSGTFYYTSGASQHVPGGYGARVLATLSVTPGQVFTVNVGGSGGYNGGGTGSFPNENGGGASDLRLGGTALANRVLIAGGGGGATSDFPGSTGGHGGYNGTDSPDVSNVPTSGGGGTQTAGGYAGNNGASAGQLGQGGNSPWGGGGGGGYYGGGGGGSQSGWGGLGGGGGSSYASPTLASGVSYTTGHQTGHGYVTISVLSSPTISLSNAQVSADQGAVLFSDQGKVSGNANQLFWDKATSRLGLGTAAPATALDVNGTATLRGAASFSNTASFAGAATFSNTATFASTANFGATTRQMVNLWNTNYGIGVQDGTQYFRSGDAFAWFTGGGHNNNQFDAGGGTMQMVLKNSRLGIGTGTTPVAPLEIQRDNADAYMTMHEAGGAWFSFGLHYAESNKIKINDGPDFGGTNYLTIDRGNGHVGIGTTNPAFPLDVQRSATPGNYDYAFYARGGNNTMTGFASSTGAVSIRASGRVVATEFNATSDRRLKTVIGLSDRAADLALLNRIRITDYTMRDRAQYGGRQFKKVIAQEVEAVFPQAVSQHAAFLPDVYAVATAAEAVSDSLLRLTLPSAVAAARKGQRVKLVGPQGEVTGTLVQTASGNTLLVRGARELAGQQVFVFGLEHPDVRTVDYEALSMLNVSATQELARQVAELQRQNAALQGTVRTLQTQAAADNASLAQRLQALENMLGTRASAK